MLLNNISFNGRYNFLQNQSGLFCAYCGKKIVSEKDIKFLSRTLLGKKGVEVADALRPYLDCFVKTEREPLQELINLAAEPRFANLSLKNLALHLSKKDVYSADDAKLIHKLFDSALYSAEHAIPQSKGGINSCYNYLPMHRGCNTLRGSDTYTHILELNPQFPANISKAVNEIASRIKTDRAGVTHYGMNLPLDYKEKVIDAVVSQGIDRSFFAVA